MHCGCRCSGSCVDQENILIAFLIVDIGLQTVNGLLAELEERAVVALK